MKEHLSMKELESRLSGLRVLVTGGGGFIGSNLAEYLLKHNAEVTVLDNFSTGKRENIHNFYQNPNFRLIEGDIRDLSICHTASRNQDFILHQAALGSVPRSVNDPVTSNAVNVSGFLNVLVAARDAGVKKIVFAASSSTYGDSKSLPKVEENIGKPLSPYAVTKYVNELYADVFFKTYGLPFIGLRYFNVFGRKQDPDGAYAAVIPLFIKSLLARTSPTINGDGTNSRDFTYIDNVIQMNIRAMLNTDSEADNEIYNVAYGQRSDLMELFTLLKENLGKYYPEILDISPIFGENRKGDIPHSLASIEKAEQKLGYSPTHSLRQGLEEATDWYWQNYKH